jgi:hypothetical protein
MMQTSILGLARLALLTGVVLLAGCTTAGQPFTGDRLGSLQPGRTTLVDATHALNGPPEQMIPQSDGSTLARWNFKVSFVTDAVYYRKEAIMQFGVDGRLIRLVDTTNIQLPAETRQKLLGAYVPTDSPAPGEEWQPAPLQ